MVYIRLYRLGGMASDSKPDAIISGARVFDNSLELFAKHIVCQQAYTGPCRAEIVYDKDDFVDLGYIVFLHLEHGEHKDQILKMASRSNLKRKRRNKMDNLDENQIGAVNELDELDEMQDEQEENQVNDAEVPNEFTDESDVLDLEEALGDEAGKNELIIDHAKKAEPIVVYLQSGLTGTLTQFINQTRRYENKAKQIKRNPKLRKAAKETRLSEAELTYMDYVSSLLSEMILDLSDDYVDEHLVARHVRFMDLETMQRLLICMIKGEVLDPKAVEALNVLQNKNEKDSIGAEQSQVSRNTMGLVQKSKNN